VIDDETFAVELGSDAPISITRELRTDFAHSFDDRRILGGLASRLFIVVERGRFMSSHPRLTEMHSGRKRCFGCPDRRVHSRAEPMADPVYNFELREVTIALLKQQGIYEGRRLLSFEFQFGAGMMGPAVEQVRLGAMVQIMRLQLVTPPTDAIANPVS
jgi:hypothetical protein